MDKTPWRWRIVKILPDEVSAALPDVMSQSQYFFEFALLTNSNDKFHTDMS